MSLDCKTLLSLIYLYMDGEASAEQEATLMKHVHGCNDCRCIYEFESAFRDYLSKKLNEVAIPQHEIDSLKEKISAQIKLS